MKKFLSNQKLQIALNKFQSVNLFGFSFFFRQRFTRARVTMTMNAPLLAEMKHEGANLQKY